MLRGSRPVAIYPLRKRVPPPDLHAFARLSYSFSNSDWGRRYLYQHRRPHLVRRDVSPVGRTARDTNGDAAFVFRVCFSYWSCSSRLPASEVGMIVDKGGDFPQEIDAALRKYGESMWFFREQEGQTTTRALNSYIDDHRKWVPANIAYPALRAFLITFLFPDALVLLKLSISYA